MDIEKEETTEPILPSSRFASSSSHSESASSVSSSSSAPSSSASSSSSSSSDKNSTFLALPYIDSDYQNDIEIKAQVDALLTEELSHSTKSIQDYLKDIPEAPETKITSLREELKRVSEGKKMTAIDEDRYLLKQPIENNNNNSNSNNNNNNNGKPSTDSAEWERAIDRAKTVLEHQSTKMMNLELMKRFGGSSWKIFNDKLLQHKISLDNYIAKTKQDIDAVNRKRKTDQLAAAPMLGTLEQQFYDLSNKNNEIETACYFVESDVKRLRQEAIQKGLLSADTSSSSSSSSSASVTSSS
eukprot:TRINITY_DN549_c0_g1_i1.p1 TRINITY_DN549_c0_g1~~TRINITY_DN549_c0_g1_i1.p1  ORF type:complete len:319 (+),score=115.73 TRINITY_DN549_c0_g1_i1:61-957(+)